jgi:DNA-directed RNA polymerase specialized sigma24 family protein
MMMDVVTQELEQQEDTALPHDEASLTPTAFTRLLEWLDDGVESHGERYLEMRRRLVGYFDRRNRPDADDLADETLNRISRTLEKSGSIAVTPPARYCYVVARFVLLEDLRHSRRYVHVDGMRASTIIESRRGPAADPSALLREARLDCLDRCLAKLPAQQRELVIAYYHGAKRERIEGRRALAARLGISMNALGIRACRIRAALESCVAACRGGGD